MRFWLFAVLLALSFVLLPVLAGLSWPESFVPEEIGRFLHGVWEYWVQLIRTAIGK